MRISIFVLVAGLLLSLPLHVAQPDESAAWWGPTEVGEGFHIRIPVTASNNGPVDLEAPMVTTSIDIAQVLMDAGWPAVPSGQDLRLRSFDFDAGSVRVVAMSSDGARLRVVDPTSTGLDRFVIPADVHEMPAVGSAGAVDVAWRALGTVEAGGSRQFMVYLDSSFQADHAAAVNTGPRAAAIDTAFGPGWGTEVLGIIDDPDVVIHVTSLVPANLEVMQWTGNGMARFEPPGLPAPIPASDVTSFRLPEAGPFRIRADAPILAWADPSGHIPALTGGFAGRSFVVPVEGDAIYLAAAQGNDGPTRVHIQALAGTFSDIWEIQGEDPRPYTVGRRANGFSGDCSPSETDVPGPGIYRVDVVSGGDIQVINQPTMRAPIPAMDGGAYGQDAWAIMGWSHEQYTSQYGCLDAHRQGGVQALSAEDALMSITSDDAAFQMFPAGNPSTPTPPGREIPADTLIGPVSPDMSDTVARDRPLRLHATAPTVWVAGTQTGDAWGGAWLGADSGRDWLGAGSVDILTFEPGTRLEGQRAGKPLASQLGAGQWLTWPAPETDPLQSFRLTSNHPIAVYTSDASHAFFAARPAPLESQLGTAEFRGHLVEIASPSGRNPLPLSVLPGQPLTIEVDLVNHGRGAHGAPLADTFDLAVRDVPSGWAAGLEQDRIRLESGEGTTIMVEVTAPAGSAPGDAASFRIEAVSQGNPAIVDALHIFARVRTSHDVDMWLEAENGPKSTELPVQPGAVASTPVVIANTGSVRDTFDLEITGAEPGWLTSLQIDGEPAEHITLDAGEVREMVLEVSPGEGTQGVSVAAVRATSRASPAVFAQIIATAFIQQPSDLTISLAQHHVQAPPGETTLVAATLRNNGQGSALIDLEATMDAGLAWAPVAVLQDAPGGLEPAERLALAPGDEITLLVGVRPEGDALAGERTTVRLAATLPRERTTVEAFMLAEVAPVHRLEVDVGSPQINATHARATLELANAGNGDEMLRLVDLLLPPGWSLEPSVFPVARGEAVTISVPFVTSRAPPGSYDVSWQWQSLDGARVPMQISVEIPEINEIIIDVPVDTPVQPGVEARITLMARNAGNAPATVAIVGGSGVASTADLELLAGAEQPMALRWLPADGLPDGLHQVDVELMINGKSRVVTVDVDMGRPVLAVTATDVRPAPTGRVVAVVVENEGTRPAQNVHIQVVGGGVNDTATLRWLEPGDARTVWLSAPAEGPLAVRLGHAGEPAPATLALDDVVQDQEAPGGSWWWTAVSLMAWCRRPRKARAPLGGGE